MAGDKISGVHLSAAYLVGLRHLDAPFAEGAVVGPAVIDGASLCECARDRRKVGRSGTPSHEIARPCDAARSSIEVGRSGTPSPNLPGPEMRRGVEHLRRRSIAACGGPSKLEIRCTPCLFRDSLSRRNGPCRRDLQRQSRASAQLDRHAKNGA